MLYLFTSLVSFNFQNYIFRGITFFLILCMLPCDYCDLAEHLMEQIKNFLNFLYFSYIQATLYAKYCVHAIFWLLLTLTDPFYKECFKNVSKKNTVSLRIVTLIHREHYTLLLFSLTQLGYYFESIFVKFNDAKNSWLCRRDTRGLVRLVELRLIFKSMWNEFFTPPCSVPISSINIINIPFLCMYCVWSGIALVYYCYCGVDFSCFYLLECQENVQM